jgi:predicted MFS family arabinose efflux permease
MQRNERILLITLAALNFTNIMDFMIMMPLGPVLMDIFKISPAQFSLIVSSYTFSAGISGVLTAFIVDRFDRKRFLQFVYSGFITGTLACALAPGYEWLVAARIFTGLFGGVISALILSIVGDVIPLSRRGEAMGFIMAAFSVASVFGVPFGYYIAEKITWHAPFVFLALCGLPIFYFISRYVPHLNRHIATDGKHDNPWEVIVKVFSVRNHINALVLVMVLMIGHFSIIPLISPYMVANVGFAKSDVTYIYLFGGALTMITSRYVGKLADRLGKLKVMSVFVLVSIIPIFLMTNMPRMDLWLVLIVTSFFFVFSGGRFIPTQAMVTGAVNNEVRGSFMSISSALQQLCAGVASYVAGLIVYQGSDGRLYGYNYVGYLAILATLSCLVLARFVRSADGSRY